MKKLFPTLSFVTLTQFVIPIGGISTTMAQTNPTVEIYSSGNLAIQAKANFHALYARSAYIPIYSSAAGASNYQQEGVRGEINSDASNPYNQYAGVVGLGRNALPLGGQAAYNIGVFGAGKHGLWGKSSENAGFGVYGEGNTGVMGISQTGGVGVHGISYGGGYAGAFWGNVAISQRLGIGLAGEQSADFLLDVGGRARIRSGGSDMNSAGVWFNNNANTQLRAFVGMRIDNEFGFYSPALDQWMMRFNVTTGTICTASVISLCSDQRLKTNFSPLQNSLNKLSQLRGYHYDWIKKANSGLQTGLIAQDVQKIFPELVETDNEGFLSVNYIGLIPHLLEAIKDLKNQVEAHRITGETLLEMNKDLKAKNEKNEARLNAIESALKQLTTPSETAGK